MAVVITLTGQNTMCVAHVEVDNLSLRKVSDILCEVNNVFVFLLSYDVAVKELHHYTACTSLIVGETASQVCGI